MAFLQFGHSLIFFLQKKISPDTLPIKETNTINSFIKNIALLILMDQHVNVI